VGPEADRRRMVISFPVTPRDAALFDALLAALGAAPATGYQQPTLTSWPTSDLATCLPGERAYLSPLDVLEPSTPAAGLDEALSGAFPGDDLALLNEPGADAQAAAVCAAVNRLGWSPFYLLLTPRPQMDTAFMVAHTGLSPERIGLALVCRYLAAEAATRGAPRMCLNVDQILAHPIGILIGVARQLGLPEPSRTELENWRARFIQDFAERHPTRPARDAGDGWLDRVAAAASEDSAATMDGIRAEITASASVIGQILGPVEAFNYGPSDLPEHVTDRSTGDTEALAELSRMAIELRALQARTDASEKALEDMRASTFWRMTAPLRQLKNWADRTLGGSTSASAVLAGVSRNVEPALHALADRRPGTLMSDWHIGLWKAAHGAVPKEWPGLTISIVLYNSERWLAPFCEHLMASEYPLDKVTLIFVDNGSTDGTCEAVEAFFARNGGAFRETRLERRPNKGYGVGNDHAIRMNTDDLVLITNVDSEFTPTLLTRLVSAALADDPSVACWEARQALHEHPKYYDPVTLETNWSSHACVLMRRAAYLDIGGYDPAIFMYGEDVELSYRYRRAGWRLRYVPSAVLKHHVDLQDTTVRPHQLSGSLAANLLLRQRYGSTRDVLGGETLFARARKAETAPVRIEGFDRAARQVKEQKAHFRNPGCDTRDKAARFPFNEFDFDLARPGADTAHMPPAQGALPKASIVIRTHGDEQAYLEQALASALNQTYTNLEIVVVEDRTRNARELVESIASAYGADVRYIASDGPGRSIAGNDGVAAATGELVCFLDNDDLLFAEHVEILASRLIDHPDAEAAYALAWEVVSDRGVPIRESGHSVPSTHTEPFDFYRLARENMIPIQSILFRKSLFDTRGGFHADLDRLEDWNLWVRYATGNRFEKVNKVTSLYRTPKDQAIRSRRQAELNRAYELVYRRNLDDMAAMGETGAAILPGID